MSPTIRLKLHNDLSYPVSEQDLLNTSRQVLRDLLDNVIVDIDVTISDEDYIHNLNKRYRGMDQPTDVLSFPVIPFDKGAPTAKFPLDPSLPINLGDIVICYPIAAKQAKTHRLTPQEEVITLFEHGLKHLLGFHHT